VNEERHAEMRQPAKLTCSALTPDDWPALERLFGARGACGGCWCMFWRARYGGARFEADKGAVNRRKFRELVRTGRAQGCLAFRGGEPVGWVSVGPRESFPYFERSRALAPLPAEGVWSVTCFFVRTGERGAGVASALLDAAVELARAQGAQVIEGYPISVRRGARAAAAFAWTGVPALFERAAFRRVEHPSGRLVYRRAVQSLSPAARRRSTEATRP
jgi:GNAT superfamily N-acetyltransferase